jgi:hypothetical protein
MTPRDVPGRLEIRGLFPWLDHVTPAQQPARRASGADPSLLRPESAAEHASEDLPKAA